MNISPLYLFEAYFVERKISNSLQLNSDNYACLNIFTIRNIDSKCAFDTICHLYIGIFFNLDNVGLSYNLYKFLSKI